MKKDDRPSNFLGYVIIGILGLFGLYLLGGLLLNPNQGGSLESEPGTQRPDSPARSRDLSE